MSIFGQHKYYARAIILKDHSNCRKKCAVNILKINDYDSFDTICVKIGLGRGSSTVQKMIYYTSIKRDFSIV